MTWEHFMSIWQWWHSQGIK